MKTIHLKEIISNIRIPAWIILTLWLVCSCVSLAPVNTSFDSAKTLNKGQVEFSGNYSPYYLNAEDDNGNKVTEKVNDNFGFRFGYGIIDRLDLKFRYERMLPRLLEDKYVLDGVNYFALSPRYGIVKNRLAGGLDLGLYTYTMKQSNTSESYFFISPKLAFTYPSGKKFDLTLSTKIDIFPSDQETIWGLNLGCGISSDLEKWALRPEIGFLKDLSNFSYYTWFNGGIALVLKFNPGKAKSQ
jgi:hypothetical protein